METQFTPKQIAIALKVSESSVKRWCDSGAISTVKTVGGHRRITLDGLKQFLLATNRMSYFPSIVAALGRSTVSADSDFDTKMVDLSDLEGVQSRFEGAMSSGDELTCRAIFKQWIASSSSLAAFADQILRPTFEKIGEQWSCDQLEVYQERRGCEIAGRLIQEFRGNLPAVPVDAPLAIGAAPSDDPYTLPGQLIEAILLEGGWRAVNLGANIPLASLSKAIIRERPRLFWLSVSSIPDQTAFVEQFQKFANSIPGEVALVVGGRALSDRIRPQLKFHAHCDNMRQLSDFASALRGVRHVISPSSN